MVSGIAPTSGTKNSNNACESFTVLVEFVEQIFFSVPCGICSVLTEFFSIDAEF